MKKSILLDDAKTLDGLSKLLSEIYAKNAFRNEPITVSIDKAFIGMIDKISSDIKQATEEGIK